MVISSRIASSATLALKSDKWLFRFVILDHFSHKLIHLNYWSEFPRPPLYKVLCRNIKMRICEASYS